MSQFKSGFARLDVTPPLGVLMAGSFSERKAEGILDNLYTTAVAVNDGLNTAVVISIDMLGIHKQKLDVFRKSIAEKNSISVEAVFIECTHTHSGPVMDTRYFTEDLPYIAYLERKLSDVATIAIADLKPASVSIGSNTVPGISFIRRFRMKNGNIQTNPGIGNPNIVEPISTPDETLQLVRIHRENADEILMVNFQTHPAVVGGYKYSADYVKFVRDTLEKSLDNVKCIYLNGAQGDTNHINVYATPERAKTDRGYEHAEHMGKTIAGAVLQIYMKTTSVKAEPVRFGQNDIEIPSNRSDKSMIPEAERIISLQKEGRENEIPFTGMELITVVAEAFRIKRLENGPDSFVLPLTSISFGEVCLAGVPGEPFTDIGRGVKENSPFEMTMVSSCANGYEGYFPMKSAFDEGGYEARSSSYKPGVAEAIVKGLVDLIKDLNNSN